MTREQAKQMAEVLNAYAEGKPIEVLLDDEWGEVDLNEYSFDENESYRIKKEPTYRPFKNAEECFVEMKKHQPVGWICWGENFLHINKISHSNINLNGLFHGFDGLLNKITFADGKPFGIKE